jgi:hypothetical protein
MIIRVLTSLLLTLALLTTVPDTSLASYQGARYQARRILFAARGQGFAVRSYYTQGLLQRGQSTILRFTLTSGVSYKIVVGGCEDCYDIDAALYDESGNFIDSDGDASAIAIVNNTPRWTGTFYLRVTMYDSTYNGAHFVVQYAYQ